MVWQKPPIEIDKALKKLGFALIAVVLIAVGCTSSMKDKKMTLSSSAFENNGSIPEIYTCEGQSINPPLQFSGIPEGTKTLALLMDDPDVPRNLKPDGVFDHWTVFNMPVSTIGIPENNKAPGITAKNGAGQNEYTGPCPPDREHRYFFKLYALDQELVLDESATKQNVLDAMGGHIIEQTELIGKYNKKANR